MSRYIDADALKEWLDEYLSVFKKYDKGTIKGFVDHATSIDIVRCKECRYCKKKHGTFKGEPIIFYCCEENNRDVESDDYCSFGERSRR